MFIALLAFFDRDEVDSLIDELVVNTKKLAKVASDEFDKWRRW